MPARPLRWALLLPLALAALTAGVSPAAAQQWELDLDYRETSETLGADLPEIELAGVREVELDTAGIKSDAQTILSDSRYDTEQVVEPSLLAKYYNWLVERIVELIEALFGGGGTSLTELLQQAAPFLLVLLGIFVLVFGARMLVRWLDQRSRTFEEAPETEEVDPAAYLQDARGLLERGRTRLALRSGFNGLLAALSIPYSEHLPNREIYRRVEDRFPREVEKFRELLEDFEVVWYGERIPARSDVDGFLDDSRALIERALERDSE